jgi:hypothetical protein
LFSFILWYRYHIKTAIFIFTVGKAPTEKIAEAANPDDPSIHFLLSTVYRNQANDSEAKVEIRRYGQLQQKATEKATQHAKQCHGDPVKHPVGYCARLNGADE